MNAAYRYWEEIGWYPQYYICLDKVVGVSHQEPIEKLIRNSDQNGIELFLLRQNLIDRFPKDVKSSPKIINFDELKKYPELLKSMPITTGSHAALFGALLDYKRIALLGIDCNYVEKVDGAQAGSGTELVLTKTPNENPNYFFEGYQVAGDAYNIPNPTPDLHINSWIEAAPILSAHGVQVWNCSFKSRLQAFPVRDFAEIEAEDLAVTSSDPTVVIRPTGLSREAHARVDETAVVADLLSDRKGARHVMLDVGAHFGTSAAYFDKLGWSIHCFEPDQANRQKLVQRFGGNPNVTIDPRALSDNPAANVPFFSSQESSGISGLHAFAR